VITNKVLRKLLGHKRMELRGGKIRLHNRERHDFHPHQIVFGLSMKEDEMGRALGAYGGEKNHLRGFCGETGREEITWKEINIDVRMILKCILNTKERCGGDFLGSG
jgi:hypothetical protein